MKKREKVSELRETVAYVMAFAPKRFPVEDFLPADSQMNLDRAYKELRERFVQVAEFYGEIPEIAECRAGIEESYQTYRKGDKNAGFLRIQEVYHILMKL